MDGSDVRSIDSGGHSSGEMLRTAQCLGCFPDVFFDQRSNRWIGTTAVKLNAEHTLVAVSSECGTLSRLWTPVPLTHNLRSVERPLRERIVGQKLGRNMTLAGRHVGWGRATTLLPRPSLLVQSHGSNRQPLRQLA
jgi:hypothetical protein